MNTLKNIATCSVIAITVCCCKYADKKTVTKDTVSMLARPTVEAVSEKNTDIDTINNIDRPKTSKIIDPVFSTKTLFGIWVVDPKGPTADFELDKTSFFVADYDGDGSMPYVIQKDSIIVYYNDYVAKGLITKSTKDSLSIAWDNGEPVNYVKWTQ